MTSEGEDHERIGFIVSELKEILDTMDVPEFRKSDLSWLGRNLGIRNNSHPQFNRAIELIKQSLGE